MNDFCDTFNGDHFTIYGYKTQVFHDVILWLFYISVCVTWLFHTMYI